MTSFLKKHISCNASVHPSFLPLTSTPPKTVLRPGEEKQDRGIAEALHAIGATHHIMQDFPTAVPYLKVRAWAWFVNLVGKEGARTS